VRPPGILAVVAAMTLLAPVGAHLVDPAHADELEDAERRVADLEAQLGDTTDSYEHTWAQLETARVELDALTQQAGTLEEESQELQRRLGERARTMFMHGSTAPLHTVLVAEGAEAAVERASMVSAIQQRQTASLEEAVAVRRSLDQVEQLLQERSRQLSVLEARLEEEAQELQAELATAQQTAHELRTREQRRRQISRGTQQGTYACIFDHGAFRFRDTWGAPRSGGRSHRGTDVFARMDAPVYAFTDGVIQRHSNSRLGGLGLYLRGDDGNVYYYAHLNRIVDAGTVGRRVRAGDHIADNGATGNASPSAPHVHFEVHPGGGGAINPYPWLAAACH
jgi:peptidoglycan LD-endopeptidase LytH